MSTRRELLIGSLAIISVSSFATPTSGQTQPLASLDVLVPAAAGSGWDKLARAIERALKSNKLVAEVNVEHSAGSNGMVGLAKFAQSKKGQGNAVLIGAGSMINAQAISKSTIALRDVVPIARLAGEFEVVTVAAQSPFATMKDLAAALKSDPEKLTWVGGSPGGTDHVLVGTIARAVGVEPKAAKFTSFKTDDEALAFLSGNQFAAGIAGWGDFAEHIKSGKLRALGITASKRQTGIDVPTLTEEGVNVEFYSWRGIFGAPGINTDQRIALTSAIDKMVKSPAWAAELKQLGLIDLHLSGAAFAAELGVQVQKTSDILKALGLPN